MEIENVIYLIKLDLQVTIMHKQNIENVMGALSGGNMSYNKMSFVVNTHDVILFCTSQHYISYHT